MKSSATPDESDDPDLLELTEALESDDFLLNLLALIIMLSSVMLATVPSGFIAFTASSSPYTSIVFFLHLSSGEM